MNETYILTVTIFSLLTIHVSVSIWFKSIRLTLACFDFAVTYPSREDYNNASISRIKGVI